ALKVYFQYKNWPFVVKWRLIKTSFKLLDFLLKCHPSDDLLQISNFGRSLNAGYLTHNIFHG
ncbi:MAG: hypothetical protein AB1782_09095, partial [Cyanobacteriota bacterium]